MMYISQAINPSHKARGRQTSIKKVVMGIRAPAEIGGMHRRRDVLSHDELVLSLRLGSQRSDQIAPIPIDDR
jgi:hypothetical protein